jgi:hypothetical protein
MSKKLIVQTDQKVERSFSNRNSVVTFVQMPPAPPAFEKKGKNNKAPLDAIDLFSRFTADIIKEDVIFTR